VLAERGPQKIATEIQWSSQTHEETLRTQRRYAQAGIDCIWLLRRFAFDADKDLQLAGIDGNVEHGFIALVQTEGGVQSVRMEEFLEAALNRLFTINVHDLSRVPNYKAQRNEISVQAAST